MVVVVPGLLAVLESGERDPDHNTYLSRHPSVLQMSAMEKVQVRFTEHDLEKIEDEVEQGKYPTRSEAIRDKVRKSYLLEAIVQMHEATAGMDQDDALAALDETREAHYDEFTSNSD
jgi:Arc/MetJ-type ribon-helix-helix transcriptional regulator